MSKGNDLVVYIAGPMRGYHRFNFDAFFAAEEELKKNPRVKKIYSPARMDIEAGLDPNNLEETMTDANVRDCLYRDCSAISKECNAIYMLKGWEASSGARTEWQLANCLRLQVYYQETL